LRSDEDRRRERKDAAERARRHLFVHAISTQGSAFPLTVW
jgi:hypothetical protein